MRTHESALLANYEIEQKVETGDTSGGGAPIAGWHTRQYLHHGKEVMEKRLIAGCHKDYANLQTQYNALGSFHERESITITREQFEFLKELWK